MELPTVATYPLAGGRREGSRVCLPREEGAQSRHQVYSRKTLEKPERCGLRTLSVKGLGVVFMHGEGISTPRVRHKGRQPSIKCAISCLQLVLFSLFYIFMSFYAFCIFFCGRQWCFPAPTYPQLR